MTQAQLVASERLLAKLVARLIFEEHEPECEGSAEGSLDEPVLGMNPGKGSHDDQ
jgi:hypothetical protein